MIFIMGQSISDRMRQDDIFVFLLLSTETRYFDVFLSADTSRRRRRHALTTFNLCFSSSYEVQLVRTVIQ